MKLEGRTLTQRLLGILAIGICRWPYLVLLVSLILTGLCGHYAFHHLGFQTSRNDLIGAEDPSNKRYVTFSESFDEGNDLIILIEGNNIPQNKAAVEFIGNELLRQPKVFREVLYKVDSSYYTNRELLFSSVDHLRQLNEWMKGSELVLASLARSDDTASLLKNLGALMESEPLKKDAGFLQHGLPLIRELTARLAASIENPRNYTPVIAPRILDPGQNIETGEYITVKSGQILLVLAKLVSGQEQPAFVHGTTPMKLMNSILEDARILFPGCNIGSTGEPILEHDEMQAAQRDCTIASIISMVAVGVLFVLGYREWTRPLLGVFSLCIALVLSMAWAAWSVGHLNILSVTFAVMLIGLGDDFSVHLITRFEEELNKDNDPFDAIHNTLVGSGGSILLSAMTIALSFLTMKFSGFPGLAELGVIAGGGIFICMFTCLIILSTLLLIHAENRETRNYPLISRGLLDMEDHPRKQHTTLLTPQLAILLVILFSFIAAVAGRNVQFDYNLLNLQSKNLESIRYEEKLMAANEGSVLYAMTGAKSLQELEAKTRKFEAVPQVRSVKTILTLIPPQQSEKSGLIESIQKRLAPMPVTMPVFQRQPREAIRSEIQRILTQLRTEEENESHQGQSTEVQKNLRQIRDNLQLSLDRIRSMGNYQAEMVLGAFDFALRTEFSEIHAFFKRQKPQNHVTLENVPDALKGRFLNEQGEYLLQILPRENVWNRKPQEEFIKKLREIDPEITGTPIQIYEYTNRLRQAYENAGLYSLLVIILMVYLSFRRLVDTIMVLIPLAFGFLWLAGMMGIIGLQFNPANFMVLPLLIGIGVANGVHILHRYREEKKSYQHFMSTTRAIILSSLTTILGFGSLMIASHRGIHSLGLLMALGITTCLWASLLLLPALLAWRTEMRHRRLTRKSGPVPTE